MSKKIILYALFFLLLVFVVYYFVKNPKYNRTLLLPVLSNVQPFSFINQDSQQFTEKNMLGKICVVNYFFTTCKGICPKMNQNLVDIYKKFKDSTDFLIISHTCNPEIDGVSKIKEYARLMGADNMRWIFLTGNKKELYAQARNSYLLDDPNNNLQSINDQFLHTQFFALVDKNGRVRGGIYDGLKKEDLQKLNKDILKLFQEK